MPSAHVIGLGQSGMAAARLLCREGWQATLSDRGSSDLLTEQQQQLGQEGMTVLLNCTFSLEALAEHGIARPDLVVISPGVPWHLPGLVAARQQGIAVIGEIELAWRYLKDFPWVGITGTNGKTTTTALTAAIFKTAGLQAPACGNIGYSTCDLALSGQTIDWAIAEISSYQLESAPTLAAKIAVWTTFTPDHLERHGTLEAYREAKALLLDQAQQQILNGDDPYLRSHLSDRYPQAWWTSSQGKASLPNGSERGVYLENGWVVVQDQPILPLSSLKMPGHHNQQNLLLAVAIAHLAGIEPQAIAAGVASFPGVPHRLEYIRAWQGVDWINDSKATNYDAAQTGLMAVASPAILIAGGQSKQGDDQAWLETIQTKAATVLLIGDAATSFAQRLAAIGYHHSEIVETLEHAIARSAELIATLSVKTVLFSPACASFDQFKNFEHRGDRFRQLVQTLGKE
ncbi:MAG: UDP-N-acetylmuramoyl-L-alanine--D-glutamate ligase [Aphanocapsa sp. GSE-SYN-MK-11-07L]|jgi:UDP-N-acetylmuramoylalanine--D-glutamate ligase|nr:UDP-N-acetylmuramoyl-L-alanine--D-glutamate ligase [Aphanocapsa sp. GSE-SYN-MK-11-07L]